MCDDLMPLALQWVGRVVDAPLPCGMQGAYDASHNLILLSSSLCDVQRRCVLAHEISHAKHRDAGCMRDKAVERRADVEAALTLIRPEEYASAERLYGSNSLGIAQELGVMEWVVDAYRLALHDDPSLCVVKG